MNTFTLSLDLDKEQGLPQLVTLRQGDKSGTQLVATIYDHGQLVSGSYTARVSLRHPGTGATYYRETATYSNGVATVTVDEQRAATVAGVTTGYFELLQGSSVKASTADFIVRILPSAEDGAVPGEVYDSAIEDALAELDAATGRISQMVVDATAEYLAAHPEITTTVQDNSVTDAKLIQSGGVLDRVGRLWWRLENLLTNTPAESESVTVSDAAKTPVAGLTVFGKSTQDGTPTPSAPVAIESVEGNLLPDRPQRMDAGKGVTFTSNGDGSYTIVGTATSDAYIYITNNDTGMTLPAGTYALSRSGYAPNVNVGAGRWVNGSYVGYGNNSSGVLVFDHTGEGNVQVVVRVPSGTTVNATIRPCLYRALAPFPHVPSGNVGLWSRGRNLLDPRVVFSTSYYTVNEDGSVTVLATDYSTWTQVVATPLTAGTYTLSRSDTSGSLVVQMYDADGNLVGIRNVANGTARDTFTAPAGTAFARVKVGVSASSYPFTTTIQLEHGTTAHAYEPYAESVTAIPLDGHTLRSLPDGTRDEVTVDQYGHVTLIQRVGSVTLTGSSNVTKSSSTAVDKFFLNTSNAYDTAKASVMCEFLQAGTKTGNVNAVGYCFSNSATQVALNYSAAGTTTLDAFKAWLTANTPTLLYALATPVTHDLGTIDPTALVGPDMTAQAVPTAPFALTYERDLNATLARLEAAIAEVATS